MDNTNIRASLRIMGDNYDIQEVTELLGICPSESWYKGEVIRNKDRRRTYTAWVYNTDIAETLDINMQIKKLEEVFSSKVEAISLLKKKYDLDISIDFVIIIENGEPPAIYFEPKFIEFAAKIGARFDIDTYVN